MPLLMPRMSQQNIKQELTEHGISYKPILEGILAASVPYEGKCRVDAFPQADNILEALMLGQDLKERLKKDRQMNIL